MVGHGNKNVRSVCVGVSERLCLCVCVGGPLATYLQGYVYLRVCHCLLGHSSIFSLSLSQMLPNPCHISASFCS